MFDIIVMEFLTFTFLVFYYFVTMLRWNGQVHKTLPLVVPNEEEFT